MARPKKIKTDVMDGTANVVEVVKEQEEPKVFTEEEVEITPADYVVDKVPELNVEMVNAFKVEQNQPKMPTPICDIVELEEDDKQILVEKKIKSIISQTQVPFIPALVRFKEPGTTAVPPMFALVEYDHRFVDEGWQFYKTNVKNPYVKDYLNLIARVFNNPHKIYTRLVTLNYE